MGLMAKYAIQKHIDEKNKELKIGLRQNSKGTSVYFGSTSVKITESMLPCVVVDQLQDLPMASGVNSLNMFSVSLFYIQQGEIQKYDLMFNMIKSLFIKSNVITYEYGGQTYENVIEYTGGQDFYGGESDMINSKNLKYIQFVVASPQVNY